MEVAQARPRERAELLTKLLGKAGQRGTCPERADRLILVAAACLGFAEMIDPDTVRLRVESAVRRLIPPESDQDVDMLAKAGSFVIDLMSGPDGLAVGDDDAAVRVIRTLARSVCLPACQVPRAVHPEGVEVQLHQGLVWTRRQHCPGPRSAHLRERSQPCRSGALQTATGARDQRPGVRFRGGTAIRTVTSGVSAAATIRVAPAQ